MRVLIAEQDYSLYAQLLQQAAPELQVHTSGDSAQLAQLAADCPVWLGQPDLMATLLRQGHTPQWLQSTWAGITPLLAEGLERDYRLSRAVGIFGQVMAEYVLTYMLGHEREVMARLVSQSEVLANLGQARRLLEQAAEGGAQLAVLPENFAAMGRRDIAEIGRAEALGQGPILPWLKQTARDLNLWIVAGTLPLPPANQPDAKVNACSLLISADGEQVARYDKLHLFDVDVSDSRGRYRESDDYAPGEHVVVADTPVGKLGLTVCYDLRFPELYSELRSAGAELITAPSAFTAVTGQAHWEVLIRARAIETQCYILEIGRAHV